MTRAHANAHTRTRRQRIFNVLNVLSAVAGFAIFLLLISVFDTTVGILVSAVVAGSVAGGVWIVITKTRSGPDLQSVLEGHTLLGSIPTDDSVPAPTLTDSELADHYTGLLGEVEGHTTGGVLLVSSASPGHGASTVSLNLAIAAAAAGRRVMLVDADSSPNGLGRFLSSGSSPGLSDIASGDATLAEATRMWTLDDGTRFPMLPSGEGCSLRMRWPPSQSVQISYSSMFRRFCGPKQRLNLADMQTERFLSCPTARSRKPFRVRSRILVMQVRPWSDM